MFLKILQNPQKNIWFSLPDLSFNKVARWKPDKLSEIATGDTIRVTVKDGALSQEPLQDLFKISSRRIEDVLQRSLQDVFKLLTRFQNDSETYSKRFWGVLQRRLSTEGFA